MKPQNNLNREINNKLYLFKEKAGMYQTNKIDNHNKYMTNITGNMSSIISGTCIDLGITKESSSSRPII